MTTTEENKAARTQQSRQVAQDAAEAYRAARDEVLEKAERNAKATRGLRAMGVERGPGMRQLRDEARELAKQGRDLGIPVKRLAAGLGVSRQTVHAWIAGRPYA